MNTQHLQPHLAIITSETDALLAQETSRRLAPLLGKNTEYRLQFLSNGEPGEVLTVPATALHLLVQILAEMAQGNAVTLTPIQAELTTQQAADILNVSRPYFVQLLDNGEIPHRKVGTHRRVLLEDVLHYKADIKAKRHQVLDELTAYDQELGLQ
jgi:excisionase family DNA binding protein